MNNAIQKMRITSAVHISRIHLKMSFMKSNSKTINKTDITITHIIFVFDYWYKIIWCFSHLQSFCIGSYNVQSFLQALVFWFWRFLCHLSSHQLFWFRICSAFGVYIRCSFNSESHCNAYIKRGSCFHHICISESLLKWSAYSVLFFVEFLLNIRGILLFTLNHNHAIWCMLKRFNLISSQSYCVKVFS